MGETQLNELQKAQNRAMRVILQCDRHTKVERMLQALQFMFIRQRLYSNVCIFIFKILKSMLPDQLTIVENESERQTRQAEDIVMQFCRTTSAQKSMFYEGVKMYNALPAEMRQNETLEVFKRALKEHVIIHVN
ncbi:unnamed protein product [Lasius platythorax]|uniref:Uncharacterized protein n=1 Tax=Lasius platythorax TaxID=488582 RepID=A0AAV2P3M0_9HYME